MKYRLEGKEKRISLGTYPTIGLKKARQRREEAKKLVAHGIDPSIQRQAVKASILSKEADSFEAVAREWIRQACKLTCPQLWEKGTLSF